MLLEVFQILQVEVVTCVHAETAVVSGFGGFNIGCYGGFGIGLEVLGIWSGVEFHAVGAGLGCQLYVFDVGAYKQTCAYAGFLKAVDYLAKEVEIGLNFPTCRRSEGVGGIGHQCHLFGFGFEHKVDKVGTRVTFDVEFGANERAQKKHVGVANMALIGTWVYGNSLCSKAFAVHCYSLHIWQIASAGIAQGGNLVDIYT